LGLISKNDWIKFLITNQMKFTLYLLGLVLTVLLLIACDDDLNNVGGSILPDGDNIAVETDTFKMKVRTVKVDSIYAWSTSGLLGKYEDDVFGLIKSDYMSEFYCYEGRFLGEDVVIDSVTLDIEFYYHYGDTLNPMGVSVYKLTNELTANFYTNVDPLKYCDMSELLGQQIYSVAQSPYYTTSDGLKIRTLTVNVDKKLGEEFYLEFLRDSKTFSNSNTFKKYFPGVYVTPTLGSGTLVEAGYTSLNIYYNYNDVKGNYNQTQDTTRTTIFSFEASADVVQLNHVQNEVPSSLLTEGTGSAYIKAPAGVCLEVELPVLEIDDWLGNDSTKIVNSANFSLSGYTEMEDVINSPWGRPTHLLLVDKDSLQTFFINKQFPDNKTSTFMMRNSANIYYPAVISSSSFTTTNNIALIIREYRKRNLTKNPVFVLMPVQATTTTVQNYLRPLSAVIRTDDKYMNMGVIFTKY